MIHTTKTRETELHGSGRIAVRIGDATAYIDRATDTDNRFLDHYRIQCHELDDLDDDDLQEPWTVELDVEIDLAAALRIAEVVANRADEHLGRTRRFRADALAKVDEAIATETGPQPAETEETER